MSVASGSTPSLDARTPGTPGIPGNPGSAGMQGILAVVKRYWGYDQLRPLQAEAIRAGIEHRDSLVVLPTGGGKSLCYQVPPEAGQGAPTSSFRRSSR